jgi:hypothetical protein
MTEATSTRAQDVKRRHLELLQEENAFVDESEALRRKRSRNDKGGSGGNESAGGNGDDDGDDSFLGSLRATSRWRGDATMRRRQSTAGGRGGGGGGRGAASSGEFPKRLHLPKVLQDQHQAYLAALQRNCGDGDDGAEEATTKSSDKNAMSTSTASSDRQHGTSDALFIGSGVPTLPTDEHILTAFVAQRKMLEAWLAAENMLITETSSNATLESIVGPTPSFLSTFFSPDDQQVGSSEYIVSSSSSSKHAPPRPSASRKAKAPGGNRICAVCLRPGSHYVCVRCGVTRYCSPDCHDVHDEMRCLKHVM